MLLVPLEQAAEICGVKPATIYRWRREGRIKPYPPTEEWDARAWYSARECFARADARDPDALDLRNGVRGEAARRMSRRAVAQRSKNRVDS